MASHSPTDISIVIPTVDGRKSWLAKTIAAYEQETPGAEIIVMTEYASCGEAWMEGWKKSTRPYVHFTADDIIPFPDWYGDAVHMLDDGIIPVCTVQNGYGNFGEAWAEVPCGELGTPRNVMVPFLTHFMLQNGQWLLPIHYGSDYWVSYWAVKNEYSVEVCTSYKVTHYLAPQGRVPHRQIGDMKALIIAMEEAGYLPPFYEDLKRKYGMAPPRIIHA